MASYIKTLKEDNGDITYPQTLGSAVLLTGGADLETELAGKASAASVAGKIDIGDVQSSDIVSDAVTTAKIADSAVTSAKIDWSTLIPETVSSGQTAWKFPDGKMICFGAVQVTAAVTGAYENSYYAEVNNALASIFAEAFFAAPVVTVTIEQNSSLFTFDIHSTTTTGFRGYIWGQYSKTASVKIHYIAMGKWK